MSIPIPRRVAQLLDTYLSGSNADFPFSTPLLPVEPFSGQFFAVK
jgi:hypothetical protein